MREMLSKIQTFSRPQRYLIFFLIFGGGLLLLLALFAVLFFDALNAAPRMVAVPLADGVAVREFATLPGNDAFPASITVGPDGTVYTASYLTGTVWAIDDTGIVTELPRTRETFGAIAGLNAAADGTLYVIDRLDARLGGRGGAVFTISPTGVISEFATIPDETGFSIPDDIAIDAQGNIYVSDWERDEVWRFDPGGKGQLFWSAPETESAEGSAPTGLAYAAVQDAILVTDPQMNNIYRIPVSGGEAEILYTHADRPESDAPGFDGVTVTPDGDIYVAALGLNRVARLQDGELHYLAGDFRGASDVAYFEGRLYVTNWDQRWMLTDGIQARLPFGIDMIQLPGA